MGSLLTRLLAWILRIAGVGLACYHLQWLVVTSAYLLRAFSVDLAPGRAAVPLLMPASLLTFGIVLLAVADLLEEPARGPSRVLAVLWVALAQQLAAAALQHESYDERLGEGLYAAWPSLRETAGWGPIALGTGLIAVLVVRRIRAARSEVTARIPVGLARWMSTSLMLAGLAWAAWTLVELNPDEHVEHVSNTAAIAACAALAAVVHDRTGPAPPRAAAGGLEWVALVTGLFAMRVLSRQEIVTGIFSYEFIETTAETLLFPKGKLWNASALVVELGLAMIGAAALAYASLSRGSTGGRASTTSPGRFGQRWRTRALRGVTILSGAVVAAMATSAAGAILLDRQPWLAAAELFGFAVLLASGALELADGMHSPTFPASRASLGVALGLAITLTSALARLAVWFAG